MPRYGVFTEDDAKKVAAATRRVLAVPAVRNILKQPQQTIRQASFPATTETDDGLPDGTDGCSCEHCIAGVTLPDSGTLTTGEHCCTDHLRRTVVSPWSEVPGIHDLLYITGNVWLTDPFDGPACEVEAADEAECDTFNGTWVDPVCTTHNEYRWMVTIDLTGTSYFELVLETDNGCPVPCIKYATSAIRCQCDWTFTLEHNDADFGDVSATTLSCNVCVKPEPAQVETGCNTVCPDPPAAATVSIGALSCAGCTPLEDVSGDHSVINSELLCDNANSCVWRLPYRAFSPAVSRSCFGSGLSGTANFWDIQMYQGAATLRVDIAAYFFANPDSDVCAAQGQVSADTIATYSAESFACTGEHVLDLQLDGTINCGFPDTITVTFSEGTGSPNTSGKCGTPCAAGNTPADPSTGGCCVDGFWYDYFDETECTAAGGVWNADEVAGAAACAERGACCMTFNATASKVCFESISETLCDTLAGLSEFNEDSYVWTEGETCAAACLPIGACCTFNPTACALTEEAACTGVWHEGTTCAAADCDSTTGACCCYDGACANGVAASTCYDGSEENDCSFHDTSTGVFTAGTDCSVVTCDPVAVGCCTDDSTLENCEDLSEAACLAAHPTGWTWTEGGTCDPGTPSCIIP